MDITDNPLMNFFEALQVVSKGGKVTKLEWNNKATYGYLKDGFLQLHKAGEAEGIVHPWIINDGDLMGEDWLEKDNKDEQTNGHNTKS